MVDRVCWILAIALCVAPLFGEQHPFVWGEYIPPPVSNEEVQQVMGWNEPVELKPLSGGFSGGKLYVAHHNGIDYVIRRSGGIYGKVGVPQEVEINQLAAIFGIAPKIDYADPKSGLIVMRKEKNILPPAFAPGLLTAWPDLLDMIADKIRKIEALTPDESVVTSRDERVYIQDWQKKLDINKLHCDEQLGIKTLLAIRYPRGDRVLCHNDLHGRNLLFDGKELYVIDWEGAGWGERFHDVAYFTNTQSMNTKKGIAFLERYLQRKATPSELLRYRLLRVQNAAFGAAALLSGADPSGREQIQGKPHLHHRNLMLRLDRGEFDFANPVHAYKLGQGWLEYGLELLND